MIDLIDYFKNASIGQLVLGVIVTAIVIRVAYDILFDD